MTSTNDWLPEISTSHMGGPTQVCNWVIRPQQGKTGGIMVGAYPAHDLQELENILAAGITTFVSLQVWFEVFLLHISLFVHVPCSRSLYLVLLRQCARRTQQVLFSPLDFIKPCCVDDLF